MESSKAPSPLRMNSREHAKDRFVARKTASSGMLRSMTKREHATTTASVVIVTARHDDSGFMTQLKPNLRNAPDGHRTVPGDGSRGGNHRRRRGRRATRAQIVAIHGLATRREIDLDSLLRDQFRVCQLYELRVSEASKLVAELKAMDTSIDNNVEATAD